MRTEGQLVADAAVREAAARADIVFCVGVRQQEAVGMLQGAARPQAVLLAFDSDASLVAASRLQVRHRDLSCHQRLHESCAVCTADCGISHCALAIEHPDALPRCSVVKGYRLTEPPLAQRLLETLPFGPAKKAAAAGVAVRTFWSRATSDDLLYM